MALVNRCGNKHEKVCAIKRKLSASLFSRFKIYQIFQTENKSVKPVRLICQMCIICVRFVLVYIIVKQLDKKDYATIPFS